MAIAFGGTPQEQSSVVGTPLPAIPRASTALMAEATVQDDRLDPQIRPQTLDDYIGQTQLKESLRVSMLAAQHRQEPMDHLLLYGPPGLGKTTLAMVMAKAMGKAITVTSAPALERPRDIVGILMSLTEGHVLFVDEIHRLNRTTEEILYPAMEDFALDRTLGQGPSAKVLRVPLPKFTLIGATTKAGALSSPLRDRFGMVHRLEYYTLEDMQAILHRSASILGFALSNDAAAFIAQSSRATPRIANRLLRRLRDYRIVHPDETVATNDTLLPVSLDLAQDALALFDIDAHGLDPTDRLFLTTLLTTFNGGPVGIDSLAACLGDDPRTLEDVVEPYLLQKGLVQRTPRGRMATPKTLSVLPSGVLAQCSAAIQNSLAQQVSLLGQ